MYTNMFMREQSLRLETRLKEHWDACERGIMEKSAVGHAQIGHRLGHMYIFKQFLRLVAKCHSLDTACSHL